MLGSKAFAQSELGLGEAIGEVDMDRFNVNGGSIAMRVCIVIKLGANGLINRIDEYFDPAETAPLLESADSQRR